MGQVNVPIQKFKKEYYEEYDFLYDHRDNVAGYNEALKTFDTLFEQNQNFKDFVIEFGEYRKDPISSDRECVAFMFALEKYMR